ncbi:MAG TPA: hypothetical protein PKC28_07045 [Bdellovibrionales bacterium]|nr:hypothetical protein [Bdellovibrionales bacterium]
MGIHGLKPFRFCLLLLLVATSLHCARESSKKEDGTQNTGGGVVFNSTKEQVNEALDLALKLATEPDMTKNVFVQFWKDWGQSDKNELIAKPTHLFSRAETAAKAGNEVTPNERFESPALMALSKDKILRSDKDCAPSLTSEHTDGSVSSLTIDADVCFSVRNLMRLPPSSLLRQILSLVLHEAVHMGGGEELEAVTWQLLFSKYFGARFGDLSTDIIAAETLKTMGVARIFLAQAHEYAVANNQDPRLYAQMGKFVQALDSLPELRDPLAFELKLKPKRPELIAEYSKSVQGLIDRIRLQFEINSDNLRVKGIRIPLNFMPPEKVMPSLNEVSIQFEQINELFLRMAGRTEFDKPTCISPNGGDILPHPLGGKEYKPFEFPPKCDQEL